MPKIVDLKGQKFEKLIVVEKVGTSKNGHIIWRCKCECGQETVVESSNLKRGYTKSCGCLKKGKNSYNWVGDKASFRVVHIWLRRNKPKPEFCERCNDRPAQELSYKKRMGWNREIEDYEWLCKSCHRLKDKGQFGVKPLTKARIYRIREFYKYGAATMKELSKMFKMSRRTIGRIVNLKGIHANI